MLTSVTTMTIPGSATREGTETYVSRFQNAAARHFREQQNLQLSSIGIGTYLGNANDATDQAYKDSIRRAVQLGTNVIDSAANYRFQRSERAIGIALNDLINQFGYSRDELVICTKGGYIPFDGAPTRNVREYLDETFVKTGIASFEDFVGGSHCMTPRYLQNQLDQSLRNMNVESVDVYYIHNPESQLGHVSEDEFYYRITAAFERLEENRKQGKLAAYGVATWNGFRVGRESQEYHSLSRMFDIARTIGGDDHGFRFIQLPFNLAMPEALTLVNQDIGNEQLTLLEASEKLEMTVVASASMLQGRVAQGLPPAVRDPLGSLATDAQTAIQFVRSTPGITTALVGMSRVEHVEENLKLTEVEPVDGEAFSNLFS
jgi:aryl-alcohol dehydrogenase-like predicted oxidoreductase